MASATLRNRAHLSVLMTQGPTTQVIVPQSAPVYARFSRRLRAFLVDATLFAIVFYVGAVVMDALEISDANRRLILLAIAVLVLAYDPLLVAFLGGTVGHRLTNLRVADERKGGNLSLLRASARALVKDLLGWLSFATMTLTRRHQALHDVLTHSTVQIRDASRAQSHHYVEERAIEMAPGVPSRTRRVLVIVAYVVLAYFGVTLLWVFLVSKGCAAYGRCTGQDTLLSVLTTAAWLAASIVFIVFGWKGRLWGCRSRAVAALVDRTAVEPRDEKPTNAA